MSTPRDEEFDRAYEALEVASVQAYGSGGPEMPDALVTKAHVRELVEFLLAAGWVLPPTCATCADDHWLHGPDEVLPSCPSCGGSGRAPMHTAAEWAAQEPPPGMVEDPLSQNVAEALPYWLVERLTKRGPVYRRVGAEPGTEPT